MLATLSWMDCDPGRPSTEYRYPADAFAWAHSRYNFGSIAEVEFRSGKLMLEVIDT
ncbi:Uncharacterised protein [Mycobacterium tuberculosis]|nr:Uncharacterised protein [Mycobacterium tuberculosis]